MAGRLILVPTPIDENSPLEKTAFDLIKNAYELSHADSLFCVEDHKPGRRRWIHFGLPREAINEFVLYNEHTRKDELPKLLEELSKGKTVFLMSDGGMPAFYDPGMDLVDACHRRSIPVTSTPAPNSVFLAIALSGLPHEKFRFFGFPPAKKEERLKYLGELAKVNETLVLMDTPYRLKSLILELSELCPRRVGFLAMDLCDDAERLERGSIKQLAKKVENWGKREFVLVLAPLNYN